MMHYHTSRLFLKIYTIVTGGSSSHCPVFNIARKIAVIALLAPDAKKVA